MTEYEIQDSLYHHCRSLQHESVVTNLYLFGWESDMISVTRAGYIHEYEVKRSISDFRADFKKEDRHLGLKHGCREPNQWEQNIIQRSRESQLVNRSDSFFNKLTEDDKIKVNRPNYFWYVCEEGLIPEKNIPEYSGLIYLLPSKYNNIHIKKNAKLLHKEKISSKKITKINNAFEWKYWSLRLRLKNVEK